MVLGESGLIACCPADHRPNYLRSARRLAWPNGAKTLLFSAEEPDRLRGGIPEHPTSPTRVSS